MTQEIKISRQLANRLLHLAQASPGHEICGFISGKMNDLNKCYPVKNVSENPAQRFLLDAAEQVAALKTMRENGEELLAIYHSHPNAPAIPSKTDLELAAYLDLIYFIISLNTKGLLEIRGFKITRESYTELNLLLVETQDGQ